MNNEKDELKECIAREFEEIAKEEEESLEKDTSANRRKMKPEKEKKPSITCLKKTAKHWNSEERC